MPPFLAFFVGLALFLSKMLCYDLYDPTGEKALRRDILLAERARIDVEEGRVSITRLGFDKWQCYNSLTKTTCRGRSYLKAYEESWA